MKLRQVTAAAAAVAAGVAGSAVAAGGPYLGGLQGWDGVIAPRGGKRYVALAAGGRTVVAAVRVDGGRVIRYRALRGTFGVPVVAFDGTAGGVSADGRTLVLSPAYQARWSRFAILKAPTLAVRRMVRLRGTFSFDALSPSGRTIYLVEFVSLAGNRYRIRAYDVAADRLLARPVVDKSEPGPMRGFPMARITGPGGRWVYTLYRQPGGGFVHALDTARRTAVCIDLPRSGARLALRGRRLEVMRQRGGRVATVDTRTLKLVS
jgi:hypothetical protein